MTGGPSIDGDRERPDRHRLRRRIDGGAKYVADADREQRARRRLAVDRRRDAAVAVVAPAA